MPCPAVNELKRNLELSIPFLRNTYKDWNGVLHRLQPGRDGGFNRHDAGLALDITLYAAKKDRNDGGLIVDKTIKWENEKILGEHLVKAFVDYRNQINWTEIIYQNVIFKHEPDDFSYKPGPYNKNDKHLTHIHIDWMDNSLKGVIKEPPIPWSSQAKTTQFGSLISRLIEVNEKWEKGYLSSMPLMSI